MKRIITLLLCFVTSTHLAHANIFHIGPRIGVGISQVVVKQAKDSEDLSKLQIKDYWGCYHLGVFTRFDFLSIYVQPELLLSGSGAKFTKGNEEFQLSFNKLDLPAMVGLSFLGLARVQLGPVFSLLFRATEGEKNVKDYYSHLTVGWQGGVGVDVWNMVIDFKYEGTLSKFGDEIGGFRTKHGHALWTLGVGVNLL